MKSALFNQLNQRLNMNIWDIAKKVEERMAGLLGSEIKAYSLYITREPNRDVIYVFASSYGDLLKEELDRHSSFIVVGNVVAKDHLNLFKVGYEFV